MKNLLLEKIKHNSDRINRYQIWCECAKYTRDVFVLWNRGDWFAYKKYYGVPKLVDTSLERD